MFGLGFGATGTQCGEVVFNTSMTGYQEILTDPSYCGQILTMTYPLIGNYGINPEDMESAASHVSGFVVKELAIQHSNHRASMSLADFLRERGVIGIQGIDTRALVKRLRSKGVMRGVITTEIDDATAAVHLARESPSMAGADLVKVVAPSAADHWPECPCQTSKSAPGSASHGEDRLWRVVAIDCGMKRNIGRRLIEAGCCVTVLPPQASLKEVLSYEPDGVFISNGPGDPSAVDYAIELVKDLIGRLPIFGICLGHQLVACALGATTFKMKFGHRGGNQPVKNLLTGRVEITAQNHGFAVDCDSLKEVGGVPTHMNLNDETLEGFIHREHPILAIQYHPEACPGPHDASYLFAAFAKMMATKRPLSNEEMSQAQQTPQCSELGVSSPAV